MNIVMNTDGGARGNPGPAGIGVVIKKYNVLSMKYEEKERSSDGEIVKEISQYIGESTNNQAEYKALIAGLEYVVGLEGFEEVECRLDSELVVKQLNGQYKMKNEGLKPLFEKVNELVGNLGKKVKFVHVYRESNKEADKLVNLAIDKVLNI